MNVSIRPRPFSVISFDLDDTLYDNRPIIINAEQQLIVFLAKHYPKSIQWQSEQWFTVKKQVVKLQPELAHDTSAARLVTLAYGLQQLGYSKAEAEQGAHDGLSHFLKYRSDVSVSDENLVILHQLAQRYRLIGITNGNVDAKRIGLGEVFEFVLHPGNGIRMKPYPDMFYQAASRLALSPEQLLHVGDSYKADVQGARKAGCQTVWLNPAVDREPQSFGNGVLPHLQVCQLSELLHLV
ncbi:HAD-IA family hydrolase [Shewanella mesophila]|uniref:HAD-IA family hydrolase n=1 Tax=Shewanella mesophila TaxID=2864208 RepID=UPI001C65522B|nr:HAD-IA family hydrolase [Shewanella mesophila]QYJ87903.1 HAD-IA family hydrolase [Shewanella mesophila]